MHSTVAYTHHTTARTSAHRYYQDADKEYYEYYGYYADDDYGYGDDYNYEVC